MTRSAAKRANANARYIAKRAAHSSSNAARWIGREGGAFTDVTARMFALNKTTHPVDPERCAEVSWALAAELMNRATYGLAAYGIDVNAFLKDYGARVKRLGERYAIVPPIAAHERYGQVGPPPEYFSISELRERTAKPQTVEQW